MKPARRPLFVARRNYRTRRMRDGARLLPVLGLFLFLLPPLQKGRSDPSGLAEQGLYVFTVWLALIIAAFWLTKRLGRMRQLEDESPEDSVS